MKHFFSLTLALTFGLVGYSQLFQSDLSSWNNGVPTDWFGSKTSIAASNVTEINIGATYGTSQANLINASTSHKRFTTQPVNVVSGETYEMKIWVAGLTGDIRTNYYDTTNSAWGTYNNYIDLSTASAGSLTMISQTVTVGGIM